MKRSESKTTKPAPQEEPAAFERAYKLWQTGTARMVAVNASPDGTPEAWVNKESSLSAREIARAERQLAKVRARTSQQIERKLEVLETGLINYRACCVRDEFELLATSILRDFRTLPALKTEGV